MTQPTIDELLDRAVQAINRGDRATADALAGQVLAVDRSNADAEELLASPGDTGEIRRLTILFADLVDSTALSTRIEPELYRTVLGRYHHHAHEVVDRYEGHIGSTHGDGLLAVFGHPKAHENDVHRAVRAGLDIVRQVSRLSEQVQKGFGVDISVRVGIHRGLVYLDTAVDDVFGFGANLAARICDLAEPGTVVISETVERLVRDAFELEALPPKSVKGVEGLVAHYRVASERDAATSTRGFWVGRERELASLRKSWAEATAGTLATPGIAFQGEGGIGKTRLANVAVDMAEQAGAVVLGLFGSPFHSDVGLRPVRRMLEVRCGFKRKSDAADRIRRLEAEVRKRSLDPAAIVPLLAPVLGIDPESGYEPVRAGGGKLYEQIAEGIHEYLLACLGTGPGLVLAEDMHWFDEDTIEVVRALLREDSGRLLVVITGRQLPALPGNTEVFDLEPLSDAEADKLILALDPGMPPDARQAVRDRCDGIPLFIEEVVAKLKEHSSDAAESTLVPDTLYEALFARLRSSTDALFVVEAAALIGSRFDRRLLSSVVELSKHQVDDVLQELGRGRVLQPVGKDSWRFHHELLREVAAELSPPSLRRRLHSRIADALVATAADGAPEWPLVAHHYQQAARFDEAASAYQKASANARQRGALGEARAHLTRALENIERLAANQARDRREVAVRLERGFLTSAAAGHASTEAAAEFERCLQLIGDEPTPEMFATFSALWSYYGAVGDLHRATQLVEALRMTLEDMPEWYRVANDASRGALAVFRGQYHTARATLEAAAAELDHIGSPEIEGAWFAPNDPLAAMYSFVALTRFMQGDLAGVETAFAQMDRRCEKLPFPHGAFTLCYGRAIETGIRSEAGQFDRAAELTEEVARLGEQNGFDEWVGIATCNKASLAARAALVAGTAEPAALQEHIGNLTAVVEAWRAIGRKAFLGSYDAALARVLNAAGMKDAARERVELALQMADETGFRMYDADLLRIRALTYDDPQARHAGLRSAIELAQTQGVHVFELRAAADDFELLGEPARAALVDALSRFPEDQTWPELARARALLG
ncbi:adenylate/guanylate cyclase family protein (plasmid) [Mycobacterium sp. JS623]|nr:adenylate/guanylate cyclase family protein [Mycobacterium sp. JS623]